MGNAAHYIVRYNSIEFLNQLTRKEFDSWSEAVYDKKKSKIKYFLKP